MKIAFAYLSLFIAAGLFAEVPGASAPFPAKRDISVEKLLRLGIEPSLWEGLDYDIELLPGQSYQGWYYYWSNGDTLDGSFAEQTDVSWLTLSNNVFTSYNCADIAAVGYHFDAPENPGIYTAVVEDLNGNWSNTTVLLIVSPNPDDADVFQFETAAGDTVLYTDDEDWDGFDLGCVDPYFPGETQAYLIKEMPEAGWMTIDPTVFTLGPFQVETIEFTMASEDSGEFTTHVVYEKEWRSRPKLFRYEFTTFLPEIEVTSPAVNELLVAGTTATIEWTSTGIDHVNLYYSTDYDEGGGLFHEIDTDVLADDGSYEWEVPEALSRKCAISISDAGDPSIDAESGVFYIKGYEMTRLDSNGDYEVFNPQEDGWYFKNDHSYLWPEFWYRQFDYANGIDPVRQLPYPNAWTGFPLYAAPPTFPDWPLMVEIFGQDQCYMSLNENTLIYHLVAVHRWWQISEPTWAGSCHGLAVSSLLAFYQKSQFVGHFGLDDFSELVFVDTSEVVRNTINNLHVRQFAELQDDHQDENWGNSATQTLQQLKDWFVADQQDGLALSLFPVNVSGGHVVTPFKITQDENSPELEYIHVYDSTNPLTTKMITVNTSANTWETQNGWSGQNHFYAELPASQYFLSPELSPGSGRRLASQPHSGNTQENHLEIFTSSANAVHIYDDSGNSMNFNNSDSTWSNSIPEARPLIAATGFVTPPYGYRLPEDSYEIELDSFRDSIATVSVAGADEVYTFGRSDAVSGQLDRIVYTEGIEYINNDSDTKQIHMETRISDGAGGEVMDILNLQAGEGAAFYLERLPDGDAKLANFGAETNYNLRLLFASPEGEQHFESSEIILAAKSAHQIQPVWEDLGQPLKILIDAGNDGSIDDSIEVDNLVSIEQTAVEELLPTEFVLGQNYPNPFNPTTNFEFQIADFGFVNISIYDIQGRLVKTVINKYLTPGAYPAHWNGTNEAGQRVSSGVYYYRLVVKPAFRTPQSAIDITRKMILLR